MKGLKGIPPAIAALNARALERAGLLCRAERRDVEGALACRVWVQATSRANKRGSVAQAITRNASLREQTHVALCRLFSERPRLPAVVTMERWAPGDAIDAHDNLPTALKGAVDGVAAWLGVDDGSPSLAWRYVRRHDPAWSVVITLRPVAARPAAAAAAMDTLDRLDGDASPEARALREAALAFLAAEGFSP